MNLIACMYFREFNQKAGADQVPEDSLEKFVQLAASLDNCEASEEQITALHLMMFWADDIFFPVLDILRSALLREAVCRQILSDDLFERLLNYLADSDRMPTQLMSCRCFVNLFKHEAGRGKLRRCLNLVMMKFPQTETTNANLQIALASLLLNVSICNYKELPSEVLVSRVAGLFLWATDFEAVFRILVAAGNLVALGLTEITQQFGNDGKFMARLQKYCLESLPEHFGKINEIANELKNAIH